MRKTTTLSKFAKESFLVACQSKERSVVFSWVQAQTHRTRETMMRRSCFVILVVCTFGMVSHAQQSQGGDSQGSSTPPLNVNQIAIRRWYAANTAPTQFLTGGDGPRAVAFDGTHLWAANGFSASVTKLRTSDGAIVGTFPCGNLQWGIAFDGANIWVANLIDDTITKLRASDGVTVGAYPVGRNPIGVAFDGANIWVANFSGNTVSKLSASDGSTMGTFPVGTKPVDVAFDGVNIWVTNQGSDNVTKRRASDGTLLGTFSVGSSPFGIGFDGANIWVASVNSGTVAKL